MRAFPLSNLKFHHYDRLGQSRRIESTTGNQTLTISDDCTLNRAYGAAADFDGHASPMSHGVWSRLSGRAPSPGPRAPDAGERVSPGLQADSYGYGPW